MSIVTLIRLKIVYFFPELIFLLSSAFVPRSNAKNIHSKRWRNQPIWVIYWLGYNWTSIKQLLWYRVKNMRRRREKKKMGYKREKKTLVWFLSAVFYTKHLGVDYFHICVEVPRFECFLSHVENWVLFIPILNEIACKRRTFNWLLYPSTLDAVNPSSGNSSSLSHYLHEHINHILKNSMEIL